MRRVARFASWGWALSLCASHLAAPAEAEAQSPPSRIVITRNMAPLVFTVEDDEALSQYPIPQLTPAQMAKLQQARALRNAQQLDRARETLTALLAETPHHAAVLTELARVRVARQEWAAVELLARTERAARHDSLLLAGEAALALERLGRPGAAAQITTEAWSVNPALAGWAQPNLERLATVDPKGTREALRRASARRPSRIDLSMALAQIEWQAGDMKSALGVLNSADAFKEGPSTRMDFADGLLLRGNARDSSGAIEALVDLAADQSRPEPMRMLAAHRAWDLIKARGEEATRAATLAKALSDLPPTRWTPELLAGMTRGLRQAGLTTESRALLSGLGAGAALPPELALEQAMADLRDGPPERALPALEAMAATSPEASYTYAEALFFAGLSDSALKVYQTLAQDPAAPFTGAALERIYLIEEAKAPLGLRAFGRIAYENWRGEPKNASAVAESLYRSLPQGPLWAQAALVVSAQRAAAGDARAALVPLLAVADSVPQDRLAPLARQRAGDLYLDKLQDATSAAAQYEECLINRSCNRFINN